MLQARAREELRGWKAEITTVNRAVDGVVAVKTLPGFFNSKDEALAAAQGRIDRKLAEPAAPEPAEAPKRVRRPAKEDE